MTRDHMMGWPAVLPPLERKNTEPAKPKQTALQWQFEHLDYTVTWIDGELHEITETDCRQKELARPVIEVDESPEPQADADGWIHHDGGPCPVETGTLVDIKLRNGDEYNSRRALIDSPCGVSQWIAEVPGGEFYHLRFLDIIAYKVLK